MEFKGTKNLKILTSNELGFGLGVDTDNFKLAVWGNNDEAKSNALLISKAPEMLQMLIDILEQENISQSAHDAIFELIEQATEL